MNPTVNAEARIKQLCCLGLGGEAIMPAVLSELHALIPSYSNCFSWADAQGRMSNLAVENVDEFFPVLPIYWEKFHNRTETDVILPFEEAMSRPSGVLMFDQMLKVSRRDFYRHDYYNLFFRPVHFHTSINGIVREGGLALGGLGLHRSKGDPDFKAEDQRLLSRLMPFIAHAVAAAPASEVPLVDSEHEGFVIVDCDGRIHHLTADARRLLMLATRPTSPYGIRGTQVKLPAPIKQMCRRLTTVFSGNGRDPVSAPPICHHRNAQGGFTFRAHWLDSNALHESALGAAPMIGIHIRYQEPLPVRVIRRLRSLPLLSHRQMQICLFLVEDTPNAEVARRMNMSVHTVVTHTRRLYEKLDVRNRPELVAKLTAL